MRNNMGSFLVGVVLGSVVGAAVVLLYTPSSGRGVRDQIQNYLQNLKTEVSRAAENRRLQLEKQLESMRSSEPKTS